MANLTKMERDVLNAVVGSEFHDGNDPVDNFVWFDCVSDDLSIKGKTLSGVVSSLVQKGFVRTQDEGREAVIAITRAGFEALSA